MYNRFMMTLAPDTHNERGSSEYQLIESKGILLLYNEVEYNAEYGSFKEGTFTSEIFVFLKKRIFYQNDKILLSYSVSLF